jgi:hypothetical protein
MANCEGKDGDYQTCPNIVCPGVYDFCMNGHVNSTAWTYPIVSKVETKACVWGCTAWACLCFDGNLTKYSQNDTHYQEIETETRNCPDNSTVTVVAQMIDHPSRMCYLRIDQEAPLDCGFDSSGAPVTYCLGGADCFINADGGSVRFAP